MWKSQEVNFPIQYCPVMLWNLCMHNLQSAECCQIAIRSASWNSVINTVELLCLENEVDLYILLSLVLMCVFSVICMPNCPVTINDTKEEPTMCLLMNQHFPTHGICVLKLCVHLSARHVSQSFCLNFTCSPGACSVKYFFDLPYWGHVDAFDIFPPNSNGWIVLLSELHMTMLSVHSKSESVARGSKSYQLSRQYVDR